LGFNENSEDANFGIGKIYFDQKNYQQAEQYLEKAVQIDANFATALNVLGLNYDQLKKYPEAADAFQKAINAEKRKTRQGEYYYRLGTVLIKSKQFNQAEEALNTALQLSKSSSIQAGANFHLGLVFKETGQKQKAKQFFLKAAQNRTWKKSADYEVDLIDNPDKYVY
jgi:tetratricopeptide (TPR) repeat protein